MATVVAPARSGPNASHWARKYPPLVAIVIAVIIAIAVLPSALNIPQTNPSQTLEYAPVPPDDSKNPPPANGNLGSLGLGGTSTLEAAPVSKAPGGNKPGGVDNSPTAPPPPPVGKTPSTKRCVGNPPRQTDDPLSPPCVANFSGDNGGATYQGVTADEVRVLFYLDGFTNYISCSQGNEPTPDHQYFDLGQAPGPNGEHCLVRMLRLFEQYFNDRFQTYNRFVHFYAYFGGSDDSPAARKADAADNFDHVHPFAVLSFAGTNPDDYLQSMAKRGVLNFGSFVARDESFFNSFPKLIWGFNPALEISASLYADYVCTKVVPFPVSFSGNPTDSGKRVLGMWRSADKNVPALEKYADIVTQKVKQCYDGDIVTHTFPSAGYVQDNRYPPDYAAQAMADFQQKHVTTILWPGGLETNGSKQASNLSYYPEVVVAGDNLLESNGTAHYQNQQFWSHVVTVTNQTYSAAFEQTLCVTAAREVQPDAPRADLGYVCPDYYNDIRQLFTGIQVAGPRLGPTSIDKGFHAIPKIASTDARVPACFYNDNDYTCTKDAVAEWYDQAARSPNDSQPGAYRMIENGRRFLFGGWKHTDAMAEKSPNDLINGYTTGGLINPNPPDPTGG